jgi:hypothetical protein
MDEEFYQRIELYHEELVQRLFGADSIPAAPVEENQVYPCLLNAIPPSSNIIGFGYGIKYVAGQRVDGDLVVRVYVRSKLPPSALSRREMIPSEINGIATDVVVSSDIRAFARPTECGVSVGHFKVTAGTLGCLVRKTDGTPGVFILSSSHILANENDADPGDNILEPGKVDGGISAIAKLTKFEPLNFGSGITRFDAAIAKVINGGDVLPEIKLIGRITNPPIAPFRDQLVEKTGRTTFRTDGMVDDFAANRSIGYQRGIATIGRQIRIVTRFGGEFSNPGDSGSLIVDTLSNRPVALLNGGDGDPSRGIPNTETYASPIVPILQAFQIEIISR